MDALQKIYKVEGFKGFYKASVPMINSDFTTADLAEANLCFLF